jgi:hypothetical protein
MPNYCHLLRFRAANRARLFQPVNSKNANPIDAPTAMETAASTRWPKSLRAFSNELRRLAPQLRIHGLAVHFGKRGGSRRITLRTTEACAPAAPSTNSDDNLGSDEF